MNEAILKKVGISENDIKGLECDLQELKRARNRPQNDVPHIACVGIYNAGKSTLLNALIGEQHFATGDIPTTKKTAQWASKNVVYIDTPGLNAEKEDDAEASTAFPKADAFLFVSSAQSGGLSAAEANWLSELQKQFPDKKRFQDKLIPVLSRCSEVEEDRIPVVMVKFAADYQKVLGFAPKKIFAVDSHTWFSGQEAHEKLLMEASQIDGLRKHLKKQCDLIAQNGEAEQKKELQDAAQKAKQSIKRLQTQCEKNTPAPYTGRDCIAIVDELKGKIADVLEVKPRVYVYFNRPSSPSECSGKSESEVRRTIERRLRDYVNDCMQYAWSDMREETDRICEYYGSDGSDSIYFEIRNKIDSLLETALLRLKSKDVPVGTAPAIQAKPSYETREPRIREAMNSWSKNVRSPSDLAESCYRIQEWTNYYSKEIGWGIFATTVYSSKFESYSDPYKIAKHIQDRMESTFERAKVWIKGILEPFLDKVKEETDGYLSAITRAVNQHIKAENARIRAPYEEAAQYLQQLEKEVDS